MKILIAGNMGQIGPALVAQLRYSDHSLSFGELEDLDAGKLLDTEVLIALNHNLDLADMAKTAGVKHLIIPASNQHALYKNIEALTDDNFQVTLLHYGTLCCMSDSLRRAAVLHDFVAAAMTYGEINLFTEDAGWHSLIHVNDLARAIVWAIGRTALVKANFLSMEVGSDNWTFQLKDLAEAVTRIVPGSVVNFISAVVYKDSSPKPDFSVFRSLAPNHQPRYVLEHTILQLYAAYLEAGLTDQNQLKMPAQAHLLQVS
jgi:hypothetical protein